ncbi:MAG: UDP-N-acetylenolpyruvoylglucosamine reductase, partial [Pricia sp.]|nr:UDP-N-acetylenolpyruvoylglucosamine reductase [Pricia sp.]
MVIQKDISLKPFNTFGIAAKAKFFCEIDSVDQLRHALQYQEHPNKFVISGGSNILITRDLDILVLHINIKGIKISNEDENHVWLKVMAGENWHDLVLWTLD